MTTVLIITAFYSSVQLLAVGGAAVSKPIMMFLAAAH